MPLRKPEDFLAEGSKVFRKAPMNRDSIRAYAGATQSVFDQIDAVRDVRNNQYNGVAPGAADVTYALASMERLVPQLMGLLPPVLSKK